MASKKCPDCGKPGGHPLMGHPLRGTDGRWHFAGSPRVTIHGRPVCPGMYVSIARARLARANQERAER